MRGLTKGNFQNLTHLDLPNASLWEDLDKVIAEVSFHRLTHLNLIDSRITEEGFRLIRKNLPHLVTFIYKRTDRTYPEF